MTLPPGARDVRRSGGGYINEGWHLTLADGSDAFVKTRAGAHPGEYAAEAFGLEWLSEPGALRLPRVLEVGEDYLALEWIEPGRLSAAGAEELGWGLAAIHMAGSPCFGDPRAGLPACGPKGSDAPSRPVGGDRRVGSEQAREPTPTRFGSLALPNDCTPDWPTFFVERRLRPLAKLAAEQGWLTGAGARALESVCERTPELAGPLEPPARLHGDLWSGNVMADTQGRPWLIDPTVYGGHREMDLAMLRLFGAPSEHLFEAYREVFALAEGWQERVELWQLPPMLVHGVLFGGGYCEAAQRIALRYAG
jgi:fructosamine-3-kinase